MKLDNLALVCVCVFVGLWLILMVSGVIAAGIFGFLALIPVLIVGYFLGSVISQRVSSDEDDYYDKVEK